MITRSEKVKLSKNLVIGNVKLNSSILLVPMAGFTDTVLRRLVRNYSKKSLLMSEMVSSEALKHNTDTHILDYIPGEHPLSFQLCGHKPELMAEGARKLEGISTFIDINMGCPVPKIIKNSDGAKLMTDLNLASRIITAIKQAINIPVTVKCRLGWDHNSKNHVEFAKMAEDSGADAIIVHGRTRSQMYSGTADWQAIAEVKQAVRIPVIGNGDVDSPEKARECIEISGCDGIGIGRGILGEPGLISRIEKFLFTGEPEPAPGFHIRLETALLHTQMEIDYRGEEAGVRYMRKFFAHYVKNVRHACKYRFDLVRCTTLAEVKEVFNKIAESQI